MFSFFPATFHRSKDPRQSKEIPPWLRPQLWRRVCRDTLLPLPAHCRLRGVRLGLDHRTQTLPGQLLLRGVWVHAPAAVPSCTPGEQSQPTRLCGALLHTHQDVAHQHALLQQKGADHLRKDPVHGGRPLRLLVRETSCRTIGVIIASLISANVVETFGNVAKKKVKLRYSSLWKEADKCFFAEGYFQGKGSKSFLLYTSVQKPKTTCNKNTTEILH